VIARNLVQTLHPKLVSVNASLHSRSTIKASLLLLLFPCVKSVLKV